MERRVERNKQTNERTKEKEKASETKRNEAKAESSEVALEAGRWGGAREGTWSSCYKYVTYIPDTEKTHVQ
jgi:hypothetical protein